MTYLLLVLAGAALVATAVRRVCHGDAEFLARSLTAVLATVGGRYAATALLVTVAGGF